MRYDVDRIVVQAGKPVEFVFENVDFMPHNFVVTEAGALEEVGQLAESTGLQPDAMKRQYVPASDKVLLASKLLQSREVERISFTPPSTPGVLPYVCTYPGHWRRMYGALYVVEDLDGYLADPEGYLAAHPIPVADELLKSSRPRTEWTFDDLAPSIAILEAEAGRSFQNGRQLFQLNSCATCHQVGGDGTTFGPDLAKLDENRRALSAFRCGDAYDAGMLIIAAVNGDRRMGHAWVAYRPSVKSMLAAPQPFFAPYGVSPETPPTELIEKMEHAPRADRLRASGHFYG